MTEPVELAGAALRRPLGWWLKEADARLEAAFAARLREHCLTRRGWQVLTSVAGGDGDRTALVAQLAAFDAALEIEAVVDDLIARGWLALDGDRLSLTTNGEETHAALAAEVGRIRGRVAAALPGPDYATLVTLLTRLVNAFPPDP